MRSILRNESGNIAILFGLALVPLIGLAGGAVDFAHRANVRADLQTSSDAAALAVARSLQSSQLLPGDEGWEEAKANAITIGHAMFNADFTAEGIEGFPEFIIDGTNVRVTADVSVHTSFLGILGMETLPAGAESEVGVPDPISVEMVFVLDYSKSMEESDKYVRMSEATRSFIAKVAEERSQRTKIGIVPFSELVLADVRGRDVRGTPAADVNQAMTRCLANRDYPYSASNDTPVAAQAGSRWPGTDPTEAKCAHYVAGGLEVRDLSDDFAGLSAAISAMEPVGLTNISLATEMGWHVLSPNQPYENATTPTKTRPLKRVFVLLTDGEQTVKAMGPDGDVSIGGADETTLELCRAMAADEVHVFTIAYDLEVESAKTLLANCASAPGNFHEAATGDIASVFQDIYNQITETVWLSR